MMENLKTFKYTIKRYTAIQNIEKIYSPYINTKTSTISMQKTIQNKTEKSIQKEKKGKIDNLRVPQPN